MRERRGRQCDTEEGKAETHATIASEPRTITSGNASVFGILAVKEQRAFRIPGIIFELAIDLAFADCAIS